MINDIHIENVQVSDVFGHTYQQQTIPRCSIWQIMFPCYQQKAVLSRISFCDMNKTWITLKKAAFHLVLTVGVPWWEVKRSKWKSAVRGNCGNLDGRWKVGNNQWKIGNNIDWFRPLIALLLAFGYDDDVFPTFLWWISLKYIQLIDFWFNYWSSGWNNLSFFIFNQFYIHILFDFLMVESVFSTSLGHVICFPHLHLLKTVRSVRAPPVRSICLRGAPTRGKVKWNGPFWIVGEPYLSMVRLWKTAKAIQAIW